MTRDEKYTAIMEMESIGQFTHGKYLTKRAFFRALTEGRVLGEYTKRIVVISDDPGQEYTFVLDNSNSGSLSRPLIS
jgi:hypothetical protein